MVLYFIADEMSVQLAGERERVQQLQEEVTQAQLLRQSLHDTTQELQELKVDTVIAHVTSF